MTKNTFVVEVAFKIYLQSFSKAMTNREKEGKMEIQKFEYFKKKKSIWMK